MKRYTDILKALESLRLIKFYIENKHLLLLDSEIENLYLITSKNKDTIGLTQQLKTELHNLFVKENDSGYQKDFVILAYTRLLTKIQEMLITSNESELNI